MTTVKTSTNESPPSLSTELGANLYPVAITGLVCAVVLATLTITLYTYQRPSELDKMDPAASQNRLQFISLYLRTRYGPQWPYVSLGFAVLLIVVVIVLMQSSSGSQIDIPEPVGFRLILVVVCILIALTIAILILFIQVYLNPESVTMQSPSRGFGAPTAEEQARQTNLNYLILALIILFSLALLGGFFGYLWRNRRN